MTCQQPTFLSYLHLLDSVETTVGKKTRSVVPLALPFCQTCVDGIDAEGPHGLQYVRNGRCSRTRVTTVVHYVREQTAQARPFGLLDEYVTEVSVGADRREDDWNPQLAEVPRGNDAGRVIVDRANDDITGKVLSALNRLLQGHRRALQSAPGDTLPA